MNNMELGCHLSCHSPLYYFHDPPDISMAYSFTSFRALSSKGFQTAPPSPTCKVVSCYSLSPNLFYLTSKPINYLMCVCVCEHMYNVYCLCPLLTFKLKESTGSILFTTVTMHAHSRPSKIAVK